MTGTARRVRFDPHVHTKASHDARGTVEAVLEACRDRGLDAVAITDHDTTTAARRAVDVGDRHGVLVVPGVEVSTADGHLLGLGVTAAPPVGRPFAATVEWIRDRGGLAVVPHPFQRSRHGVGRSVIDDCDGVESFNAWSMSGLQNRRAAALARRRGYPGLGGSDAHRPGMVGTAYTELLVDGEPTRNALLSAVDDGLCRAVGDSTTVGTYLREYAAALAR